MNDFIALEPVISPWMEQLLGNSDLLEQLIETHGSPINLHDAQTFESNCGIYAEVLESMQLRHQTYFARKANRCRSLVGSAAASGIGVDTASIRELQESLDAGCPPHLLVVTAAVKNRELVELAVAHGVVIILDNEDECQLVDKVAEELDREAMVGFRISGFHCKNEATGVAEKLYSRFGFDVDCITSFIDTALGDRSRYPHLRYRGLHFHLNGYSIVDRAVALSAAIDITDHLLEHLNLPTDFIDIGGGFLVKYLRDGTQWKRFDDELRKALLNQREALTFDNDGLGYRVEGGEVTGRADVYPFYNKCAGADFLRAILESAMKSGDGGLQEKLADALRKRDIELRIEPGRSLLDQVGMTVARVAFRKVDSKGRQLVGLEMNFTQMRSGSADFLLDPVLVATTPSADNDEPTAVYFCGAYCLERDILLRREIQLARLPVVGDMIAFVNTAGYLMHFFESEAHLFPLAKNLCFDFTGDPIKADAFTVE